MKYNLTDLQSYDISELQKSLDLAGVPNTGVSGNGPTEFIVHSDDAAGVDAIVQAHLLTDWTAYRKKFAARKVATDRLGDSDKNMARIGEDLLSALIAKNVIALTDLPQSAQDKLAERATLRSKIPSI